MDNLYVPFEGVDGVGKSTIAKLVFAKLVTLLGNGNVLYVREPGTTVISEKLRSFILTLDEKPSPRVESLLFGAARMALFEDIWANHDMTTRDKVIIADRSYISSHVYQNPNRDMDIYDFISRLNEDMILPDFSMFVVHVKASFEIANKRLSNGREVNSYDILTEEDYNSAVERYNAIIRVYGNMEVNNDSEDIETTVNTIVTRILERRKTI